jgi:GT2 family glycosyltransferase
MQLYQHLPHEDVEIILIDDFSTDAEIAGGIAWWQKQVANRTIRYKKTTENLGFGGAMNLGAKIAIKNGNELLIFLSNDVEVYGNFLTEINQKLSLNDKVLIGGELVNYNAGWNEFDIDGKHIMLPWLNGWFLACTDVIWQSLGGFDPIYGLSDYDDVDLSTTAIDLGYNLVALNSDKLHHLGAQSFGYTPERMKHTEHNKEVYTQKWKHKLVELHQKIQSS